MTTVWQRTTTDLGWADLILPEETLAGVRHIVDWLQRPTPTGGHRAVFEGPSGTGKTLTASLIGREVGAEVYRLDLSAVGSKYIGETEKNLSALLERAERDTWILFFDEADALFGKRTSVKDAHDRYANQEVSYLLQRIEQYSGLVILATNLRDDLDDTVESRVESVVRFPMPAPELRRRLWAGSLESHGLPTADLDLASLAERYALSGRDIDSAVRSTADTARADRRSGTTLEDLAAEADRKLRAGLRSD